MKKKKRLKKLLKSIRGGLRLHTKAPKIITPETVYSRKREKKVVTEY